MERKLAFKTEKMNYTMVVRSRSIHLICGERKFYAKYLFLNNTTGYLTDVPTQYYQLMMWILLARIDSIALPTNSHKPAVGIPLVSYSGGSDSTATLHVTGGKPIHITRGYMPVYDNRQIRACRNVNALEVITDFERVREMYLNRHGFSIGVGYIAMYIPLLPLLATNKIALGVIFDDIAFSYGEQLVFHNNFASVQITKMFEILRGYGIEVTLPLAGYSEVNTIKLADESGIKGVSSCHTQGSKDACRACYKCFRKEALRGRRLDLDDQKVRNIIFTYLKKKPLKMACSVVYAMQKAGYTDEALKRYMDIDVSWCDRVNRSLVKTYGGLLLPGYKYQTSDDLASIHRFVKIINSPGLYEF